MNTPTTYLVTTEVTLERVYTVQARSEDEAKQMIKSGLCIRYEDLTTGEEVQSVEKEKE